MIVPIGIGVLSLAAWFAARRREPKPKTESEIAEQTVIFDTAINHIKDADKLMALSEAFKKEGLTAEAKLLEQRAALNTASPEEKAERTAIYKQAMASKNPAAIRDVAQAFDDLGATGAAVTLRSVASGLEAEDAAAVSAPAAINGDTD